MFPTYLNHSAPQTLIAPYLNSTAYVQTQGKKLLMFETNTASCGGFNGVSDSFGAALWGLDYGMQLAYANFSGGLFHVGGQNVYYNPFTRGFIFLLFRPILRLISFLFRFVENFSDCRRRPECAVNFSNRASDCACNQ